jgi:sugar-specific transcriptional regulator TrmB
VYKPSTPKRLQEILDDRKKDIEELEREIKDVMPDLMSQFNASSDDREVKIFEGKSGIKQLFNDELRHADDTIYIIGSPIEAKELLENFLPSWSKRRDELGIKIKGVFEHSMRGDLGDRAPTEARFLPEGKKSKVSIAIYGDKAGIVFWIDDPLVIMIDDPDAAASFTSYFRMVWQSAVE